MRSDNGAVDAAYNIVRERATSAFVGDLDDFTSRWSGELEILEKLETVEGNEAANLVRHVLSLINQMREKIREAQPSDG